MAPGDRRSRSQSRSPFRPPDRNDAWNLWKADTRKDDRLPSRRAHDVYSDRRGDAYSPRDYNDRFGGSNTYRPRDEFSRDYNDRESTRSDPSPNLTRRRASMAETKSSSPHRPQPIRQNSHHDSNTNTFIESPMRSPISTTSSILSLSRAGYDKIADSTRVADTPKSNPKTKDPRLARTMSTLRFHGSNEGEIQESPASALTLDGSSDLPTPLPESQAAPQDIPMTDVNATDPDLGNSVASVLIRLVQPAIESYAQQKLVDRLSDDIKRAKDIRDKATKLSKYPPEMLKTHQVDHDQAIQTHQTVSRSLRENQLRQSSLAREFLNSLSALMGETLAQQHEKTQTTQAEKLDSWQKQTDASLSSLQREVNALGATDITASLKKRQDELQKFVEQAQPRFEENIDFLRTKHKEQQVEMAKLRAENVSLKADIEKIRSAVEAMQHASQQMITLNDTFKADSSTDLEAKTHLIGLCQNQIAALTGEVQAVKESLEATKSSHVLKAEFDAYKATSKDAEVIAQQGVRLDPSQYEDLQRVKESVQNLNAKISGVQSTFEDSRNKMAEDIRSQFDGLSREIKTELGAIKIKDTNEHSRNTAEANALVARLDLLNEDSGKLLAEVRQMHDSYMVQGRESSDFKQNHSLDQIWKSVNEVKDALRKAESSCKENMESHKATIKSEMVSDSGLRKQCIEKLGRTESRVLKSASNLSDKVQDLATRLESNQKTTKTDIAGLQSEITLFNTATKERMDLLQFNIENSNKIDEVRHQDLSKKLNELGERSATLSAKERLMLNTLGTIPKRLNDLENTIFESDKHESEASVPTQAHRSGESLGRLDEQINALKIDLDLVKTEVAGQFSVTNGALDQFRAELKTKASEWETALGQQKTDYQSSILNINTSLVKIGHDVRAAEHSLRSLTTRYNHLTTEKLARQIAEVVQPVPIQLKTDQAMLKEQILTIDAKLGDLTNSVATSAARQSDDQSEKLKEIREELKKLDEDFRRLEAESKALEVKFSSGRDTLQKEQDEHAKRLNRLEGRVVHKDDWPSDDEDDEDERVQREGNNLLREFQSRSGPSEARSTSVTPAPKTSISSSARASPLRKGLETSQHVFGLPSPLRTVTNPADSSKSLTSRIERPQSLASRIEPGPKATTPIFAGAKRSLPSDSEEIHGDNTVVVQSPALEAPANTRKKGSRHRMKKAARTGSFH